MHPSELILNDIKDRLEWSVDDIRGAYWIDKKLDLDDLPCVVVSVDGEDIQEYGNHYLVDLSVNLKFLTVDRGFNLGDKKLLNILHDSNLIVKRISDRLQNIMKVIELSTSDIVDPIDLERSLLTIERVYKITYRRTRGLV